jgi:hypothetical protein
MLKFYKKKKNLMKPSGTQMEKQNSETRKKEYLSNITVLVSDGKIPVQCKLYRCCTCIALLIN